MRLNPIFKNYGGFDCGDTYDHANETLSWDRSHLVGVENGKEARAPELSKKRNRGLAMANARLKKQAWRKVLSAFSDLKTSVENGEDWAAVPALSICLLFWS